MDKKTFYVTVNTGSIIEDKSDGNFEFEIQATEEEIDSLQQLFEDTSAAEEATASRGWFVPLRTEEYNAAYDESLQQVYRRIHELGSPETKAHIEKMNVLNAPIAPAEIQT